MNHSLGFNLSIVAGWYVGSGLILALVCSAPNALLDRDTGRPKRLDRATWAVVVLLWPWFVAAWTVNTWKRP